MSQRRSLSYLVKRAFLHARHAVLSTYYSHDKIFETICCYRSEFSAPAPTQPLIWRIMITSQEKPHAVYVQYKQGACKERSEAVFLGEIPQEITDNHTNSLAQQLPHFEYELILDARVEEFKITAVLSNKTYHKYMDQLTCARCIFDDCKLVENATSQPGYSAWLSAHNAQIAKMNLPTQGPLMSIVMPVYQTPPAFLKEALASVVAQTYQNWELVVVNASPQDAAVTHVLSAYVERESKRIQVITTQENLGINGNTNLGIAQVHGDYVSFFDHDDVLSPYVLAMMAEAIIKARQAHKPLGLLYCDEDNLQDGAYVHPLFKPNFNLDFLLSANYVLHFLTVSKQILDVTTRSQAQVNGAQDYDLTLKACAKQARVYHLPYVLYHWRVHSASVSAGSGVKPYAMEAGRQAIKAYLSSQNLVAHIDFGVTDFTYNVYYEPHLGCADVTTLVAQDITPAQFVDTLATIPTPYVLILAKNTELSKQDLNTLLGYVQRPDVFAVAPKVVRHDGLVAYGGTTITHKGELCLMNYLLPAYDQGYVSRNLRTHDYSALTSQALLIDTQLVKKVFANAQQTVMFAYQTLEFYLAHLCLLAQEAGYRNVFCPLAQAYLTKPTPFGHFLLAHPQDQARLLQDHPGIVQGDPNHNPNFDPISPYYKFLPPST